MLQASYARLIAKDAKKTATLSGQSQDYSIVYSALSLLLVVLVIVGASAYFGPGDVNSPAFELAYPLP